MLIKSNGWFSSFISAYGSRRAEISIMDWQETLVVADSHQQNIKYFFCFCYEKWKQTRHSVLSKSKQMYLPYQQSKESCWTIC